MIPQTPLVIKSFDANEFTIDEMILLSSPASMSGPEMLVSFRQFLIDHTSWTTKEIGAIKAKEIPDVSNKLQEAMKAISVPLVTAPSSASMPEVASVYPDGSSD